MSAEADGFRQPLRSNPFGTKTTKEQNTNSIHPNVMNTRRDFLKTSVLSGAALAIGIKSYAEATSPKDVTLEAFNAASGNAFEITPFIVIDKSGTVTLYNPRPDMGQGTWQSMPALLAEELEISLDAVKIEPTNGLKKYGSQLSGGSGSVRGSWIPYRTAGAAVRTMLIAAAAQTWSGSGLNVSEADCYAENGKVVHKPSGKRLAYGELIEKAATMPIPKEPKLKDPKDFKILGKPMPRPDIPMKVDGSAQFGIDIKVPGMLYASIERSPAIHGKVTSFDAASAKKIKGVKHVMKSERKLFQMNLEGVAVLADTYWGALQGRKALNIKWDDSAAKDISTNALFKQMRELATTDGAVDDKLNRGNVAQALAGAAKRLDAIYETPFLAHAAMEPLNVIAHIRGDKAEIWVPAQGPDGVIRSVAQYLKIPAENVTVHITFLGGAFGRKAVMDFVLEAVHLSKSVNAPVKLVWTREDDMTQGPFRPGMLSAMKGALDAQGNVVAFEHKIVGASIQHQAFAPLPAGKVDDWMTEGVTAEDSPYGFPNFHFRYVMAETQIPVVWWRSVYGSTNMFGHESFIDELAHAAGKDPLTFRLALLANAPAEHAATARRFEAVLKMLAEKSGWNEKLPVGKGRGIAITRSFATICAHAVTVSRGADGKVKIEKVVGVIDCGMTVNPATVKAQTEGNIVMGLTAALRDGITFKNGRAEQANFDAYRVLRIHEIPAMEIHIMQNGEAPGGVGEPGLPPVAPALTNAVFAATGKRIRTLPFNIDEV